MTPVASPELSCVLYDGLTPVGQACILSWQGSQVQVHTAAATHSYPAAALRVSSRSGAADRFVSLPDGAQLQCADCARVDLFQPDDPGEQLWQWFDRRWALALGGLALIAIGVWLGYQRGLALVAERIADRVPLEYERRMGDSVLGWLDMQRLLRPTTVKQPARGVLKGRFSMLTQELPRAYAARLDLRSAPSIGPNAFALPGGIVVMTDQLLALCKSPDEALVVLAHEIGHVERQHALRMVLQSSAGAALASSFTTDLSWLGLTLTGLPTQLFAARYSRELEAEADEFGFQLSARRGLQVEAFAQVMERMQKTGKGKPAVGFLASHPATAERIARARVLAARSVELAAPLWNVGDHWAYGLLARERGTPDDERDQEDGRGTVQWTVARELQDHGVDAYLLEPDDGERSQYIRREDLALAAELEDDAVVVRHEPPLQTYSWPLRASSSWVTASKRSPRAQRQPNRGELSCQVETAGLTRVPAGSFLAMKVACVDAKTRQLVSERWYAPVVRQWILERRYANGTLRSAWGLTDYKLN